MSQEPRESIGPSGPSALGDGRVYPLGTNDLLINFTLDIAYVIPSRLNISELRVALARTLASFPLFCGTLVQDPQWMISLDPLKPVPLFISSQGESKWDPTRHNTVVRPRPGPLIEKVNPLNLLNGTEPELLKVTIVTTDDSTLLGFSCSHTVADLYVVLKFFRTWSQHFTNPLNPVTEPAPVYMDARSISLTPPTDPARLAYMRSKLPPLLFHTFPLDNIPLSIFAPFPIVRIDVCLTGAQVAVLRDAVSNYPSSGTAQVEAGSKESKLSRQDAISALVVAAMSGAADTPIKQISYVVNCRGINPAILPNDAVGNGLIYAVTDLVGGSSSTDGAQTPEVCKDLVVAYARAIRNSLERARDPQYVHDLLALAGAEWLGAAQTNRGHCIEETPGHVIVNSSYRHDWAGAHFGFPGRVCWQHPDTVPTDNYVIMFPPNPVRTADGEWHTDEGACEATFNVKAGREGDFRRSMARVWAAVVGEEPGPMVVTHT